MRKRRLIWHIYPSYVLIVCVCIFTLGWYFFDNFAAFHYDQTRDELNSAANTLAKYLATKGSPLDSAETYSICNLFGNSSGYRFTVVLPSGKVTGDSKKDPKTMDNHSDRPEIRKAFRGIVGTNKRYSHTLRTDMLYVAVPVIVDGQIAGVVRTALPLKKINTTMNAMWQRLIVSAFLIIVLAVFATILSTKRISQQLAEIRTSATLFGRGILDKKLPSSSITEIDSLASSMNNMADQLNDKINTVLQQRDEQDVLFSCMVESVLAVDNEKRLIRMNTAAQELFRITPEESKGKNIAEIIRHADLINIVDQTLEKSGIVEDDIFMNDSNRYLQAHGSILHGKNGYQIGALIVLNDITRLHKLEVMRKDFVANVSHELRTPITSIKGFVDTLIDAPVKNSEDREHFMYIISQQTQRLQAIIDDLLMLSNLEHEIERKEIELQPTRIDHVLQNAIQTCSNLADKKNIKIKMKSGGKISGNINAQLLEQAIINLISNAIKYSDSNTCVDVSVETTETDIVVRVKDQGLGIDRPHIDRIFERFYRVDKSRSRKAGGTGLGLAIVKHVAISHNGHVEVDSEPGKGSTFSILLPKEWDTTK